MIDNYQLNELKALAIYSSLLLKEVASLSDAMPEYLSTEQRR
jgi:ferrous iron transport protein B